VASVRGTGVAGVASVESLGVGREEELLVGAAVVLVVGVLEANDRLEFEALVADDELLEGVVEGANENEEGVADTIGVAVEDVPKEGTVLKEGVVAVEVVVGDAKDSGVLVSLM